MDNAVSGSPVAHTPLELPLCTHMLRVPLQRHILAHFGQQRDGGGEHAHVLVHHDQVQVSRFLHVAPQAAMAAKLSNVVQYQHGTRRAGRLRVLARAQFTISFSVTTMDVTMHSERAL